MAITGTVLGKHGGRAEDTAQVRKSLAAMPSPPPGFAAHGAEPGACGVFHTPWQYEAQLDPSMGFALGEVFNAGAHRAGMILFDVRSAPQDTLARADFDYTPELLGRCATFGQTLWSPSGSEKWTVQIVPGPGIGQKSYVTRSGPTGQRVSVGLRVLAGTVSLDFGFTLGAMTEEEGLGVMTQIAQEFVDQAKKAAS